MPDGTRRRASCEAVLERMQSEPLRTPKAKAAATHVASIAGKLKDGDLDAGAASLQLLKWVGSEMELVVSAVAREFEPAASEPSTPEVDPPSQINPSLQPDVLVQGLSPSAIARTARRLSGMSTINESISAVPGDARSSLSSPETENVQDMPRRALASRRMRLFTNQDNFFLDMPDSTRRRATCEAVLDYLSRHPTLTPHTRSASADFATELKNGQVERSLAAVTLARVVGPEIKLA
ncbi:MAG: hypothetical protein SGPRY_002902, partial [Prymnesium sp.]